MTDDNYKDMVISHDKHLDKLTTSVESLADSVGSTNRKLDDVIEVISTQNVLAAQIAHIDQETRESFNRVHTELRGIVTQQSTKGCSALRIRSKEVEDISKIVTKIDDDYVKFSTLRWLAWGVLAYTVAFGTYVVVDLHKLDNLVVAQRGVNHNQERTNERVSKYFGESDIIHKELLGKEWRRRVDAAK